MSPGAGNGSAAQIERRWARRYPFDAAVEIEWGSSTILGRVRDISSSGMFLTTSEPLWIGASFAAKVHTDPPLAFDCTVRRAEPGRGFGVQISPQQEDHQAQLQVLLARLESKR
ncbi:MAG TPA: PilZ domain-containing protein [Candidatus Acidoferrum sp.]|nr:PilZ domain-containing protein [Candidatus Acidoferrum sp.]